MTKAQSSFAFCLALVAAMLVGPIHVSAASYIESLLQKLQQQLNARQFEQALQTAKHTLTFCEERLGRDNHNCAFAVGNLAHVYVVKGQMAEAVKHYEHAVTIQKKGLGASHPNVADTIQNLAVAYDGAGREDDAISSFRRAAAIYEKTLGESHAKTGRALNGLAAIHFGRGEYKIAAPLFERAVAILEKASGTMHPALASPLWNLALIYQKLARFDDSIAVYQRALKVAEKVNGRTHPKAADILVQLGSLYHEQERHTDARSRYDRALRIYEGALGKNHAKTAKAMGGLADVHHAQGQYDKAIALHKQVLAIKEKSLGPSAFSVAVTAHNLAEVYKSVSRYDDAIPLYERSLKIIAKVRGADHPDLNKPLTHLADLYRRQGRLEEATTLFRRSLAISDKTFGKLHPSRGSNLWGLAIVYQSQGQYDDAIPLLKDVVAIYERVFGPSSLKLTGPLGRLGAIYRKLGRLDDAAAIAERVTALTEKAPTPSHAESASALNQLALVRGRQKRFGEAIDLYKRAIAIEEKALGAASPGLGGTLNNLASVYHFQKDYDNAAATYERALSIKEQAFGENHPDVAAILSNLAVLHRGRGHHDKADPLARRAYEIRRNRLGPNHPDTAVSLRELGLLEQSRQNWATSFRYLKSSADIYEARARIRVARSSFDARATATENAFVYGDVVDAAWLLAREEPDRQTELTESAFAAAQWSARSSTEAALNQMAARLGTDNGELGREIREQQNLSRSLQGLEEKLIKAISAPRDKFNSQTVVKLRTEISEKEKRLAERSAHLATSFPDYSALANPRPAEIGGLQKALAEDEALILYQVNTRQSYVWAVTRAGVTWKIIKRKRAQIAADIVALRASLDPISALKPGARGFNREAVCRGFARDKPCKTYDTDLTLAHRLYQTLMEPVADAVKDKRHLILVPSGPLTGLPFHMLLTDPPEAAGALEDRFRKAQWLIRRHAVSVLPAVSSLRSLRRVAKRDKASRPYIGFGNPVFRKPAEKTGRDDRVSNDWKTRGFSSYFRGQLADVDRLSGAIPQLPDTADELLAVGKLFNARKSEIFLGRKASESVVKELSAKGQLGTYRVVHFATHGLVAGEIRGLAEPALALSLPAKSSPLDDGLLTASEVASLALKADWVVLSACNTAAGDKPGADALSGLARAFFYSGTQALLVSHWPVVSEAAVKLTTTAFAELRSDPTIGRAEALRRSMLARIDEGAAHEAHPAYWAPFIVVGEGGRRTR